jgi:hypothetical protein
MKKLIILMILVSITVSCKYANKPQSQKTIGEFNVEYLFENDGCKVYRFVDNGRYIYFSDCRGRIDSTYSERHGKSNHTVQVETLNN